MGFFVSSRVCVPKSWQGEALCSVFVGIFPCPSETWFCPSVLILLVFCFLPSSNDSTLTMRVKNSTKSYFYVMAGSETTLFCDFHPCFQLRRIVLIPLDSSYTNYTCVGSTCQVLNLNIQLRVLKTFFPWFVFIPPLCNMSSWLLGPPIAIS